MRLLLITIFCLSLLSCKKDDESPTPTQQTTNEDTTNNNQNEDNHAPIANPQRHKFPYGTTTEIETSPFISDEDGDIPFLISAEANHGTVTTEFRAVQSVNANQYPLFIGNTYYLNIIEYTPDDPNYIGYDTIHYVISDSLGETANGEVWLHVGIDEQIDSYDILSPYFGIEMTLWDNVFNNKLTLYSDGTFLETGNSLGMIGGAINNQPFSYSGVWKLNIDGNIVFEENVSPSMPDGIIKTVSSYIHPDFEEYKGYSFDNLYNYAIGPGL